MQITGKCIAVLPVQSGSSAKGGWKKQQFVIETDGEYAKKICFELFGDKVDKMPPKLGDNLTVHFNMESREYQGKWYSQINAWKLEGFTGNLGPKQGAAASGDSSWDELSSSSSGSNSSSNQDDELPF